MSNLTFTLRSGRRIGVTGHGDPAAERVVIFCHPVHGSGEFDPAPLVSEQHDVQLIGIDRPGYGASDPWTEDEWPTVSRAADDIAEYLRSSEKAAESLGTAPAELGSVGVVGWAAGGRVALALAARHPDLVDRVVVVATPAPHDEVPWVDPAIWDLAQHASQRTPSEAIDYMAREISLRWGRDAFPPDDPEAHVPLDLLGVGRADATALEYVGLRERLDTMVRNSYAQGMRGFVADILSFTTQPWGFEPRDVEAPTLLVYGGDDTMTPQDHALWYADALPNATLQVVPGAGHLVIVPQWKRILEFLG